MVCYWPVDRHLSKLLPVWFLEQIVPGTFEYAANWLVDHEIDLAVFDARYRNDETGAAAYDPAVLLEIVLLGYARGLTSSRADAGRQSVIVAPMADAASRDIPATASPAGVIACVGDTVSCAQRKRVREPTRARNP